VSQERARPEGGLVPSGTPIGVVLVEDNDVFRETLELLLDVTPDLQVIASVPDGRSALDVCQRVDPDVVVMDYRLPELDGVEVTGAIRRACPEAAVVVLTGGADPGELAALREAGAVACLTKDQDLEAIAGAIREAAASRAPARGVVPGE
jgi:two-component system nitrate/nitrite response regulator NarP